MGYTTIKRIRLRTNNFSAFICPDCDKVLPLIVGGAYLINDHVSAILCDGCVSRIINRDEYLRRHGEETIQPIHKGGH